MIILPDIHGRTFWKKAVNGHEEDEIIFLGDYLDPYMDEFPMEEPFEVRNKAIDNFKEIIDFKKNHMENVILLVGNHDLEYMISTDICDCRRDHIHYKEIQSLFRDNKELFQLCYQKDNILFSHSGIRESWINAYDAATKKDETEDIPEDKICDILNSDFEEMMSLPFPEETELSHYLSICSFYRGGWFDFSSPVWGDVREWIYGDSRPYKYYQIFAHTRLGKPVVTKDWACLDCSRGFILDNENKIKELNGEEVQIMELNDNNE